MIQITRVLARQFRAMLRKSVLAGMPKGGHIPVVLQAGRDGLRLHAHQVDVGLEYHLPGSHAPEVITCPSNVLDDCQGNKDTPVTFEDKTGTIQVRWDDHSVPQIRDYPRGDPDDPSAFPELPQRFTPSKPELLTALAHGVQCASHDAIRFAINRLQLRGSSSEIVSTDGRQLLVQKGIGFPWKEDLLVPALPIFGSPELPQNGPVTLGRTKTHVSLRIGPWTIVLSIDSQGRFPQYENVIPKMTGTVTRWQIDPDDALFLDQTLPRLPGASNDHEPVTVDLNGEVVIRSRESSESRTTEVVLARSKAVGEPVRFSMSRTVLARAVAMNFLELRVVNADKPMLFQDEKRQYVVMPLAKELVIGPSNDAICIVSAEPQPVAHPSTIERRKRSMSAPSTNGHNSSNGHSTSNGVSAKTVSSTTPKVSSGGINALIGEALALKGVLRDAYTRTNQLMVALKRQKKQSQAVQASLAQYLL